MFVHIRIPTTVSGLGRVAAGQILCLAGAEALPLIAAGNAVPDPYLDELKARARKAGQNVDWEYPERRQIRAGVIVADAQESFAPKLKRATEARAAASATTVKQHKQQVEKNRARYKKPVRRQRSKSDG